MPIAKAAAALVFCGVLVSGETFIVQLLSIVFRFIGIREQ
jgi:hypothetical protein